MQDRSKDNSGLYVVATGGFRPFGKPALTRLIGDNSSSFNQQPLGASSSLEPLRSS